ncbi:MAG: hypothetical protein O3A55_05410 [Bacteroidetes bacterium]|nr:hypothetical protein [Bacteroidota bacterium]
MKNSKQLIYLSSFYGSLLVAGIWNVPGLNFINAFCCVGTISGSLLAIFLYKKEIGQTNLQLTKDVCLQIGIFTGLFGAVASSFLSVVIELLFGNLALEIMMQLVPWNNIDVPDFFNEIINEARNQHMSIYYAVPAFLMGSIFYTFILTPFTIIGGLIGWGIFKDKN